MLYNENGEMIKSPKRMTIMEYAEYLVGQTGKSLVEVVDMLMPDDIMNEIKYANEHNYT